MQLYEWPCDGMYADVCKNNDMLMVCLFLFFEREHVADDALECMRCVCV